MSSSALKPRPRPDPDARHRRSWVGSYHRPRGYLKPRACSAFAKPRRCARRVVVAGVVARPAPLFLPTSARCFRMARGNTVYLRPPTRDPGVPVRGATPRARRCRGRCATGAAVRLHLRQSPPGSGVADPRCHVLASRSPSASLRAKPAAIGVIGGIRCDQLRRVMRRRTVQSILTAAKAVAILASRSCLPESAARAR